jgi:site-specific DNA-methyltransferase (adenine-specific)
MWEQVKRILKPRGVFVTTASQPFTSKLVMSNLEWFRYEVIWDKVVKTGHLNAPNMPLKRHENIVVFSADNNGSYCYNPIKRKGEFRQKGGPGKNGGCYGEHAIDRKFNNDYYPDTILELSRGSQTEENDHPTQKPVALYKYLILTYTNPGDTVLDFCFGSGTTGVACVQTGRKFIGIEISKEYCDIAVKRIKDAEQQMRLF